MKKIVILISGRGSNMEAIVRAGLPAQIVSVVSNRADAAGLKFAAQEGIPTQSSTNESSTRGRV
jgi:phosphoribosylglycinamide formyltransferase-1